jgi:hypothetical protein
MVVKQDSLSIRKKAVPWLIAEASVRARIIRCGICGGQNDTVIGLSLSSSVFPW